MSADPLVTLASIRCFVSGDPTGDRIGIRYFKREQDDSLVAKFGSAPALKIRRAMRAVEAVQHIVGRHV